jgi:hypothetical protein
MNLEFEPVYPKNVLLASVVHGISCLFCLSMESPNVFQPKLLKKNFKMAENFKMVTDNFQFTPDIEA